MQNTDTERKELRLRKANDFFTVEVIKDMPDPNGEIDRKELLVSLFEFPHFYDDVMHLGPNPRRPEINKSQRKEIEETLKVDGEHFHLYNGGITIVAKYMDVENKRGDRFRVRLHLAEDESESESYGLLDGGHTNAVINKFRMDLIESEDGQAEDALRRYFVPVQVMIPGSSEKMNDLELKELLRKISQSRNNNIQVKQRDLKNLAHAFDLIKEVIEDQPYAEMIKWREGDKGRPIDGEFLLILLMIFHEKYRPYTEDPINCYGNKAECREAFCDHLETKSPDYTKRLVDQLPTLLALFERIELEFPKKYNSSGGKFKKFTTVDQKPSKTGLHTDSEWKYSSAWIYPLFAGFRQLLVDDGTKMAWKTDPLAFWARNGTEVCVAYRPLFSQLASSSATKVARSLPLYQTCRMQTQLLLLRE